MTITATNGTLQLAFAHLAPWSSFGSVWRFLWWVGDAAGVLLVAPFILTWRDAFRDGIVQGEATPLELAILVVATLAVSACSNSSAKSRWRFRSIRSSCGRHCARVSV